MSQPISTTDLIRLPVAKRIELIEALWDSLEAETPERIDMPDWHRAELDKRLEAHERDPGTAIPWTEAKSAILEALEK